MSDPVRDSCSTTQDSTVFQDALEFLLSYPETHVRIQLA